MDPSVTYRYEPFPNKSIHAEAHEPFVWNEPASTEYQTWAKLFQTVPRGVQARKFEEEEHARQKLEAKQMEEEAERNARGPDLETWMPDDVCKVCYRCEEPFTLIKRRHHCRVCGLVFCGNCSSRAVPGQAFGFGNQLVRACDECYETRSKRGSKHENSPSRKNQLAESKARTEDGDNNTDKANSHADDELDGGEASSIPRSSDEGDDNESDVDVDGEGAIDDFEGAAKSEMVPSEQELPKSSERLRFARRQDEISQNSGSKTSHCFSIREKTMMESLVSLFESSEIWKETYIRLCSEACELVRPDPVLAGDLLEIGEYVRIQLISGSIPEASFKINGAVMRKNVVDRFMPREFTNPRIMLIESGLELNRGNVRLMSFEKLLEQERLYLDLVVRKICSVKVDVLLVGGTISGFAQDLLVEKGVAVASLVSRKDLQWISRLTGAMILPTTEYITRAVDPTGTCEQWRCETIFIGDPATERYSEIPEGWRATLGGEKLHPSHRSDPNHDTFMFFEGCLKEKGCTVCLRGEPWTSLKNRTPFFLDLLKRLWTMRLDHAFIGCMDGEESLARSSSASFSSLTVDEIPNFNLYGLYETENADLLVLTSDRIEIGRVWLQHSSQFSVPETNARSFYSARDRSFGEFLLKYCFDIKKSTNNMADGNYVLVFLHGHGRLRISSERLAKADVSDFRALKVGAEMDERLRVLTWGVCKLCGEQTNVRCLDKFVMGMSFAKWLQNTFYMNGLRSARRNCTHSLLHDYLRFFYRGDFVVTVEFEPSFPLKFDLIDRLDLTDSSWFDSFGEQLLQEFSKTCDEVRQAFDNSSVSTIVGQKLTELLGAANVMKTPPSFGVSDDGPQERRLDAEHSPGKASPNPSDVNRLFRDLFVACVEWNALIMSASDTNTTSSLLPPLAPSSSSFAISPRAGRTLKAYNSSSSGLNTSNLSATTTGANDSSLLGIKPNYRLKDVGPEPRLKRRPSLPEIQQARELVLKKTFLGETSIVEDDYVQIHPASASKSSAPPAAVHNLSIEVQNLDKVLTTAKSSPSVGTSNNTVLAPSSTLKSNASSSSSFGVSSITRTPSSSSTSVTASNESKANQKKPVQLPARLVEGHLLLPPGKRLNNAVTPVRESEPTSWIAHALGSDEYSNKLMRMLGRSDWEKVLTSLSSFGLPGVDEIPQGVVLDDSLHINCGFSDASEYSARQCAFSVRTFYAAQFHALRMLYTAGSPKSDDAGSTTASSSQPKLSPEAAERRFVESLSRCTSWKPTGGKSKATFLKTLDDRFILKSVSQEEFEMFQELAPRYFAHLANVFGAKASPSMLVPILGLFSVTMQSEVVVGAKHSGSSGGGTFYPKTLYGGSSIQNKLLVAVSPNIFYKRSPQVMYDLKGNARNRLVRNPEPGAVKLDVNFFQDNRGVPLSLEPNAKQMLNKAVINDAAFLASVGVVDYSLLVGVDDKANLLSAGIIDYLQLYNYKKMFESTVKKAAGQAEPTVVSPRKYQARFVLAMERYFLSSGHPILVPRGSRVHPTVSVSASSVVVGSASSVAETPEPAFTPDATVQNEDFENRDNVDSKNNVSNNDDSLDASAFAGLGFIGAQLQ